MKQKKLEIQWTNKEKFLKVFFFFYGGDSDQFNNALEFLGLSPINREFGALLMSDLGLKTMTQNKLSIHVDSGNIFFDNHNTGENFYSFLLSQQNDEAAYVPKELTYFCSSSLLTIKKSSTCQLLKTQNTCFIILTTL